jgi:hypothetical protein
VILSKRKKLCRTTVLEVRFIVVNTARRDHVMPGGTAHVIFNVSTTPVDAIYIVFKLKYIYITNNEYKYFVCKLIVATQNCPKHQCGY